MKILVRLPNWLGDVVMSTAFLEVLYQHYPKAEVHLILKKELMDLGRLIPYPVSLHAFSKQEYSGLKGAYRFGKLFRPHKFDLFFCLPDSLSSTMMGWATKARKRIGFNKGLRLLFFTHTYNRPRGTHRVAEYVALLEKFTGTSFPNLKVALSASPEVQNRKLVLVNFNSEASSRRMPVHKGREIIARLLGEFPSVRFGFIGAPKEMQHVEALIKGLKGDVVNYAGQTDLISLSTLMASADFIISTDSGPAHLANSLHKPMLTLFGAGNEFNTAPYNIDKLAIMRLGELPCEPCVKNHCKFGSPKCLEFLDINKIIETCKPYLTR